MILMGQKKETVINFDIEECVDLAEVKIIQF